MPEPYFDEDIANVLRGLMRTVDNSDLGSGAWVAGYRCALLSVAEAFGIEEVGNEHGQAEPYTERRKRGVAVSTRLGAITD
jgi:hypothetical protein